MTVVALQPTEIPITRADRDALLKLVKQKERLRLTYLKAWRAQREAQLETDLSKTYSVKGFPEIAAVYEQFMAMKIEISKLLDEACAKRGIPSNFRPTVHAYWDEGGYRNYDSNKERVRAAARRYLDEAQQAAKADIQNQALQASATILAQSIASAAALAMLERIDAAGTTAMTSVPSLDDLKHEAFGFMMPTIEQQTRNLLSDNVEK